MNKKKYWYHITIQEYPVCGRGKEYRERRYNIKPKDESRRYDYQQIWCRCYH